MIKSGMLARAPEGPEQWLNGSGGKVSAMKAWGLSADPQNSCEKSGIAMIICNGSREDHTQSSLWNSLSPISLAEMVNSRFIEEMENPQKVRW